MLRQNGGKQARDFIRRHPVVALLAGIVGVCSLPALACMAFFAAISVMVFFSVQGLTCIALATVVGPVFMTGLSFSGSGHAQKVVPNCGKCFPKIYMVHLISNQIFTGTAEQGGGGGGGHASSPEYF